MENFIRAYVVAKERASQNLMSAAKNDYEPIDKKGPYYPEFKRPKSEQQFDHLWPLSARPGSYRQALGKNGSRISPP